MGRRGDHAPGSRPYFCPGPGEKGCCWSTGSPAVRRNCGNWEKSCDRKGYTVEGLLRERAMGRNPRDLLEVKAERVGGTGAPGCGPSEGNLCPGDGDRSFHGRAPGIVRRCRNVRRQTGVDFHPHLSVRLAGVLPVAGGPAALLGHSQASPDHRRSGPVQCGLPVHAHQGSISWCGCSRR